jgi:hypothetical protein
VTSEAPDQPTIMVGPFRYRDCGLGYIVGPDGRPVRMFKSVGCWAPVLWQALSGKFYGFGTGVTLGSPLKACRNLLVNRSQYDLHSSYQDLVIEFNNLIVSVASGAKRPGVSQSIIQSLALVIAARRHAWRDRQALEELDRWLVVHGGSDE